ncbi:3-oxoacyl-[acyl-carrier-protein] synthase III C-terminal domain-containing protein [Hyphomonas sp.]|uniref:3-oxoacyl-[acyl-carrier-protein] synthase III C-terminal domain-containing protein n=1 Tax=Hyphomonas sp. TaxID=87 RepID=UPI003F6FA33D
MNACITSIGGYLPLLRLDRANAAREFGWTGLSLPRRGMRAVAGWDEDPLTLAVEAARQLTGHGAPEALRFASTSAYFTDRAQSAIMTDALALPATVRTSDLANSRRAATSSLLDALLAGRDELITASEKRVTQPGNASHLGFGDGAAAARTGPGGNGARLVGHASLTHDFVDRYASTDHRVSYAYEERFVRDVAVSELLLPAIRSACQSARLDPSTIAQVAAAEPVRGCWAQAARELGMPAENHCATLEDAAGDLGAAHALFALGLAFAAAKSGDHVLLVGFGSGIDAMIFKMEETVVGAASMADTLIQGELLTQITRFLSLTSAIDIDWGMRAEFMQKAQATVLERVGRDTIGFIGGRDSQGNVQFPKSAIPVNPAISGSEQLEDVRLADDQARIISVTADRLNFTPDPPFDFGLVQFENGARVLMEMADRPADGFTVGQLVRMRLRIKSMNRGLGFRTYFWKAAPVQRPHLGDAA